jgi:hypothetical protein
MSINTFQINASQPFLVGNPNSMVDPAWYKLIVQISQLAQTLNSLNFNPATGLMVVAQLMVATGFGCNGKSPQTAFASGGAAPVSAGANGWASPSDAAKAQALLNNIRDALVANGIMS